MCTPTLIDWGFTQKYMGWVRIPWKVYNLRLFSIMGHFSDGQNWFDAQWLGAYTGEIVGCEHLYPYSLLGHNHSKAVRGDDYTEKEAVDF